MPSEVYFPFSLSTLHLLRLHLPTAFPSSIIALTFLYVPLLLRNVQDFFSIFKISGQTEMTHTVVMNHSPSIFHESLGLFRIFLGVFEFFINFVEFTVNFTEILTDLYKVAWCPERGPSRGLRPKSCRSPPSDSCRSCAKSFVAPEDPHS